MPAFENFDALFAVAYQREALPQLLPGDRAERLLDTLAGALAKLDRVAASEIVERRVDEDLHARFERMFRFYRAVEEFADSDFLSELHSESEREVVRRLRDELRRVQAIVTAAVDEKASGVSEAADLITAEILAHIEREQRARVIGTGIQETIPPMPSFDEFITEDDDGDSLPYPSDDDYADEDYDGYDDEGEAARDR